MTVHDIVIELKPLFESGLLIALATTIVSSLLGSYVGLRTFRHQSRELIDGTIAWRWVSGFEGENEEPFLYVQNRSDTPAFVVKSRILRGILIRTESRRYAFSYEEPTDGSYPLTVTAKNVSSFPLSMRDADRVADRAAWYSRLLGYLLRRSYVWIEVTTITGVKLRIPANDVTSWEDRPLWLTGRWWPEPVPDWKKAQPASSDGLV